MQVAARRRRLQRGLCCAAGAFLAATVLVLGGTVESARAQTSTAGSVTRVIDGDTVQALLTDGRTLTVRVIGIDTPERGECGTDEATAYMEQLALGVSPEQVGSLGEPSDRGLVAESGERLERAR